MNSDLLYIIYMLGKRGVTINTSKLWGELQTYIRIRCFNITWHI